MRWIWLALLIVPMQTSAADWSVDAGYVWRRFSPNDQLGATSPTKSLGLRDGHGPAVQATLSTDWDYLNLLLRTELAYLFLRGHPDQQYRVGDRTIQTLDLVSPYGSVGLGVSTRLGPVKAGLLGGMTVQAVAERTSLPFDYDVVPSGSLFVAGQWGRLDVRASWNVMVTPTTLAKGDYDVSHGIFLALGAATPPPQVVRVVRLMDDPTPTAPLPEPVTSTQLPQLDHQTDAASEGVVRVLLANKKLSVEVRIRTNADPRATAAAERFRQQLLSKGIAGDRIMLRELDDGKFDARQLIRFVFVVSRLN